VNRSTGEWRADKIKELEALASRVLDAKRATRPRRPLIIEFCGSPKSGKSSAITALTIFLKRNGFKVEVLTERASVCPIPSKTDWLFNVWTACAALVELTPQIASSGGDVDVVICDRAVFDALCWFRWLEDGDVLNERDREKLVGFLTLPRIRGAIDLVFAFDASPETSVEREYANLLTTKRGSIMNESVLEGYRRAVAATVKDAGSVFRRVEMINTSDLSQNEVSAQVTQRVLEALSDATEEHIGYVSRNALDLIQGESGTTFPWDPNSAPAEGLLNYGPRDVVEADVDKVQIIPIVVLTDPEHKRVMVFRKSEKSLGGDNSPEKRKTLPYAGGHMRREDAFDLANPTVVQVAASTLDREIREELGLALGVSEQDLAFCIWDNQGENTRSLHHMAMVFVRDIGVDDLHARLDDYEFVVPGSRTVSGKVLDAVELAREGSSLEAWGRSILRSVFEIGVPEQESLLGRI
jgi:predicted NUDIX family phosphoesterase/thymidylate kinase